VKKTQNVNLFNILDYGAVSDGKTLNSRFIQSAIDDCFKSGGGTVYFPTGTYLSGTIEIKSNVCLYLEAGCVLKGSSEIKDYKTVGLSKEERSYDIDDWLDWAEVNNYHPFIYARDGVNVGIKGPGTIDAQGKTFTKLKADYPQRRLELPGGFISYTGYHPRPENGAAYQIESIKEVGTWGSVVQGDYFVEFRPERTVLIINCNNVKISDIVIEDATCFAVHLVNCNNVFVHGIHINNALYVPNTDGIDIDACNDVVISDCIIYAGDDAVCIKNKNSLKYKRPCRNITVTNCVLVTTCNAFKFGTESEDNFENVTFSNSVIYNNPLMEPKWRALSGITVNMADGAHVSGFTVSNIVMEHARTAFSVKLVNRGRNMPVPIPGTLNEVSINNIIAKGCTIPSSITGLPEHYVKYVSLNNIRLISKGGGIEEEALREIPERPSHYPETTMYGKLPASGLYCRHVDGLRISNFSVDNESADARPTIVGDDVKNMSATGLDLCTPSGKQPVIRLINSDNVFINGNKARKCRIFVELSGAKTKDVTIMNNDLRKAIIDVDCTCDADKNEVYRG